MDTRSEADPKPRTMPGGKGYRVLIAGGGTGGHLFPGLATAREIVQRRPDAEILFVTGNRPMERHILERSGFRQASIQVEGLMGRGWRKGARVVLALPRSFFQARRVLRSFSPVAVLGVGGYSSGPVCVAARTLKIPTAVHEQNSFPGLTNRLLCRIVDRVFISFEESRAKFPTGTLVFTGNPVREELLQAERPLRSEDGAFSVLVVGGSQGARAVNTAVVAALGILKKKGRAIRVVHQTGKGDYERVLRLYTELGLRGVVTPFIDDMAEAYLETDLVVGRAGASTVAELASLGKPSVLVPYPYATNNHQVTNARALSDAGGAVLLLQSELSGRSLAHVLARLDSDREALREMGERARDRKHPEAARAIVDGLEALTARKEGVRPGS
jgi:UDP-N-acetylglucosamine--N-acetylmuramyl-(pentapeptide) pyrophosphoryl-undecaprenol N-acetylglucosamine transferase